MSINKNFVVKHGLEVNEDLILANADSNRVGIATTNPLYTLHVNGGIGATDITIFDTLYSNDINLSGRLIAGSTGVGSTGQYLRPTATGVGWADFPTLRTSQTTIATANQIAFSFPHTVGLLDVYLNGVRLSSSEYNESSIGINLIVPASAGDVLDFIGYSIISSGVGTGAGIAGISVLEEGSLVGNVDGVTSINFVGSGVTAVGTGAGVTVYITSSGGSGGSGESYWSATDVGIHTLSNVGVGTTNPTSKLTIEGDARITGILTVGSSSITLDGLADVINVGSGVTIDGSLGSISASSIEINGQSLTGSGVTSITAGSGISIDQSTGNVTISATESSYWSQTDVGINTSSNVGIGTTNPTSALTVQGDVNISGVSTFQNHVNLLDGDRLYFGADQDFFIGHETTPSPINYISGQNSVPLSIFSDNLTLGALNGENFATFTANGSASLYYDNSKKFETLGTGVTITGTTFTNQLNVSGVSTFTNSINLNAGNLKVATNGIIKIGDSDQLELYYNGSIGQTIKSTGDLRILTNRLLLNNSANDEQLIEANQNGSVALYYDNSKKFETIGSGVTITGTTFTNQLSVSGITTTNNIIKVRSDDSTPGRIDYYCEVGNAHYTRVQASPHAEYSGNATVILPAVSGDIIVGDTSSAISQNLNTTGIITAANFVGDGSGLTGVIGSGSGVVILDSGSTVGTAGTIDFGENISVSAISAGVVTVTSANYWNETNVGIYTLSNVGIATTNPQTPLQVENIYGVKTGIGTFTAAVGVAQTIDSFTISQTDFKTAEYTIHIGFGSYIQSQKVLVMQNGSNAYSQEYAIMYHPELVVSIGATISGGELRLHAIPESGITGLTTYRFTRQTML